ncbi:peptidylprolyl isomerase [Winogradskyella sp.]|uniref:peptidylprolyl isomerase n=1 Tax=Winogradskyella sp. TaxID=1883156 RepID=UPI0025E1F112|nr:peptidylprolyl isomerase [Winogradskyella sp.]
MKKLLTLLLLVPFLCFSQDSLEQELDSISTSEDAKSFAKIHKKANKSKLFTFNKEKHKTRLADDLFKLSKGGKKVIKTDFKKTYYKIIDKAEVMHYRVSYIYFDGSKMTLEEINTKRDKLLSQYKDGYKFEALAKMHSMDPGAKKGGDLGWFAEGDMYIEFENAVKAHNIGDVYTLDMDKKQWYYIILNTYDPKSIEEITILKFTEAID